MTISNVDFWSFINELGTRNPNLGIPALEDGLFANLLIFNYLYYIFVKLEGKREGKKGRGKGRGNHLYRSEGRGRGSDPATKL